MLGLPGSGIGPLHPPCFLYECKFTLNLVSVIVQGGNNNTYCHDSELNWFNWEQAIHDDTGYARFFRCLVNLRLVPGTGWSALLATVCIYNLCHLYDACSTCHTVAAVVRTLL